MENMDNIIDNIVSNIEYIDSFGIIDDKLMTPSIRFEFTFKMVRIPDKLSIFNFYKHDNFYITVEKPMLSITLTKYKLLDSSIISKSSYYNGVYTNLTLVQENIVKSIFKIALDNRNIINKLDEIKLKHLMYELDK